MCCTVQLLVTRRRPKILSDDDLVVLLHVAFFIHKEQALLFAERSIGERHAVLAAPRRGQTVVTGMDLLAEIAAINEE